MGKDKKDEHGTVDASLSSAGAAGNDRVCSRCGLALPWTGEGGGREACPCPYCGRDVKPEYRAPHERALAFRNTLRELVKVKTVPDRVLAELRTCWQRNIWTNLPGSDGRLFKTFGDFCRDVRGLGCEPAPVEALLTELIGATAFALSATPVAQPGRRTDRLDPTSRRSGERSRPSRTHTRHRTIHRGPPVLVEAVGCKVLGKMHAEFLAGYHQENPGCARFAALMHQLEDGVAAQGKAERAAARTAISEAVQALKSALRRSPQGRM